MENLDSEWMMLLISGWKTHYCPRSLLSGLVEDAASRGASVIEAKSVSGGLIDLPGIIMADRTYQSIIIDEFMLEIPTEDFEYFYNSLRKSKARTFPNGGKQYFKTHGWLHCIVMSPVQRIEILERMEEILPEVRIKATEERSELKRRVAKINSKGLKLVSDKIPESIPHVHLSGKPGSDKN